VAVNENQKIKEVWQFGRIFDRRFIYLYKLLIGESL
jgi:hypothetical protein